MELPFAAIKGGRMQLALDTEEATLLHRILTSYLSDLRAEIGKTENFDFRQGLKEDEVRIKALLNRLMPSPA